MRPVHYMLALLVVVLWGVNFIFIDFGLRDWPPLLLVAARFTLVVFPAIFFVKFPRGDFRRILLIGVFMSAGQFGLLYTSMFLGLPAGLTSIVIQIQAAFTVLVAALALREFPNRRQIIGILIGLSGLGVIGLSLQASVPIAAFLVALGASLSWAIGNVIARGVKEGTNGVQMTVWSALVVPVPLFVLSLLVDGPAEVAHALAHPTWGVVASIVYTAGCASLIGYVIWNSLLARFPASQVAPFSLLVPLVGVLSAWLVLGDRPTVPELIGGVLLLLGVAVTTGVLKTIARSITGSKQRSRKVIASEKPEAEHSSASG
ncbi:MAG: EamA family transporter [Brevibacterium aurantiacum]|uniref:EamA family transporter n=1 Tax=Brevibacterium aurantiacum TaxID=273384 RepID=A0A2A3Z7W1_BREAU|nr:MULTISPECIES: EamA family transporter [Brevibacterium]MDN5551272.1 EamA family transporter [Brevibacterium sp.]AZT94680.1 EamA family transporter [Brevibacterium aurantiacum]MDN5595075.1 EamA family transporter [Brevibacterium sp.]MDN5608824.1 EamA family transporter [Brevibacterium sp.]MDN5713048.1 EamA family transporter [Brevibacterium aurantiacum]